MTPLPEPDPAKYSVYNAHPSAQHAHQVAGLAVAVVAKGHKFVEAHLGNINFSTDDEDADTPWRVRHRTPYCDQPFVLFASVWASAIWLCHDDDVDYDTAMFVAWDDQPETTGEYESRIEELCMRYGSDPIKRSWEWDWYDELKDLWPSICEVAVMLLDGQPVAHEKVQAAVNRYRNETTPSFARDDLGVSKRLREIDWDDEEEDR